MTWGGRKVAELYALVIATYGPICHLCGSDGADSIDHVITQHAGGGDELENLRPAHGGCNSARGAMTLIEWFTKHPLPANKAQRSFDWTQPPAKAR
ncbi:hypothetical protein GCM10009551_088810 [Nocardiopsis tropica]|uniref:HNH endonuclease n=1 Tax=Tsukamurella strandjordii TaxID=147577 RepID=UPI0031D19589